MEEFNKQEIDLGRFYALSKEDLLELGIAKARAFGRAASFFPEAGPGR